MRASVALLRAVNVGGTGKVKMADIRTLAEAMGLSDVKTLLQSGNLLFADPDARPVHHLEADLEEAAEKQLGLSTTFIIRSASEWEALVAANPFADAAAQEPNRLLVMPMKGDAPRETGVAVLRQAITGPERIEAIGRTLYLHYPEGAGRSKLTNALIERKLEDRGTARNWNTVKKIEALLADR